MPVYQNNPQTKIQSQSGSSGEGVAPETLLTPELGFVLDQSGSMQNLVNEAVAGFNTLVDEQRDLKPPANFSLALRLRKAAITLLNLLWTFVMLTIVV